MSGIIDKVYSSSFECVIIYKIEMYKKLLKSN